METYIVNSIIAKRKAINIVDICLYVKPNVSSTIMLSTAFSMLSERAVNEFKAALCGYDDWEEIPKFHIYETSENEEIYDKAIFSLKFTNIKDMNNFLSNNAQ